MRAFVFFKCYDGREFRCEAKLAYREARNSAKLVGYCEKRHYLLEARKYLHVALRFDQRRVA